MSDYPDRLSIIGMRFEGRHGVLPDEKVTPQPFEVDLVLLADLGRPSTSDDLGDTIDYAAIFDIVRGIVVGPSRNLIEALAGAVARAVLEATDPAIVGGVDVRVRKPRAPIDGDFETVEAALTRRR